jgi:pimeloyl-ACP methyl ester carboxylesterase
MDLRAEGRARIAAVTGGTLPDEARVAAGPLTLHCLLWGSADDPPVVLLHGNGGHAHWWDALVPDLVPGWRLVAPDLRGHGESAWAEPPRYAIADFAADVTRVLDGLGLAQAVLVGHSMGGRVAAWYASEHPERVRALAVLDSRVDPVPDAAGAAWRTHMAGKRHGRGYPTREAALAAFRFVPEEPGVDPTVIANLAHHAVARREGGEWTFRFDRAVLRIDGDGARDLPARLRRIRCPTLVLAGASSWVMDATQRDAVRAAVPDAAAAVFAGGHHFLLAHPRRVGAALRAFLARLA